MRGQMEHAMHKGGNDAVGSERSLCVVAKKFRIAEDVAGPGEVPTIPPKKRQDAACQPPGLGLKATPG